MNAIPQSVVALTGAGISAESGISTFRTAEGLWENHPVAEVATPEGFDRNPPLVYEFYNQRRRQLLSDEIKPNPAHTALAKFEHEFNGSFLLVTQNVDNLHERAGSQNLLHMHGELLKMRCLNSEMVYDLPAGGRRLVQKIDGYRYTVQSGEVTYEDGVPTGALPSKLVRGPQPAPH